MKDRISNLTVFLFCLAVYTASPGGSFVILCVSLWYLRAKKSLPPQRHFIVDVLLTAFVLRAAALAVMSFVYILQGRVLTYTIYPGWTPNLIGDASYYTLRGYWIAAHWAGADVSGQILKAAFNPIYGWTGYTYVVAAFHYLFGFSPVSSVLVNCCCALLSGFFAYSLAREYLSERISRLTALLVLFFPSMFLWSITNLKDTSMIMISLFILWAYVKQFRAKGRRRIALFVLMFIGTVLLSTIR
ncbi:MAG TPA: glycosyltransferase family 39 protein, partial [Candidatus Omnitrophota bacterium]|nr:glycosyltransferase family 39 protein [Candidatus Omnitrophota bacterium]